MIDEDGIWGTVSIGGATPISLAKNAEGHDKYKPNEPVDERYNKVNTWDGRSTAEEHPDKQSEYAVDRVVCHIGEGEDVRYITNWYGFMPADYMVRQFKPFYVHLIKFISPRIWKNDTVQPRSEPPHVNRRWKVRK